MISQITLFFKYLLRITQNFIRVSNPNDIYLSLGLYLIYPAILFLFLDKFHGLCGRDSYMQKLEAIVACQNILLWFTILLRTYKFFVIILYSVDAAEKEGSERHLDTEDGSPGESHNSSGLAGLLGKLKCQTWMHLSHELAAVTFVAFLILICLPVLAFWFMFLSILISIWNLIQLFKRLWNESQDTVFNQEGDIGDLEFQEFLSSNFEEGENEGSANTDDV